MKKRFYFIAVLPVVAFLVGTGFTSSKSFDFSAYSTEGLELNYDVPTETDYIPSRGRFHLFLGKSYLGFKEALGFRESQGDYHITNGYGYMGKYQFSHTTLKMMGFRNTENFLYDTQQQEAAFLAYTSYNKWVLRKDIEKYVGRTIGGVEVTESGILAAAHLAGPGNVKKFLRSSGQDRFSDANGTSIRHYLETFSGYDTSHIVAKRKRKMKA